MKDGIPVLIKYPFPRSDHDVWACSGIADADGQGCRFLVAGEWRHIVRLLRVFDGLDDAEKTFELIRSAIRNCDEGGTR